MNWLDLVILLTLAWFTIAGATAGVAREAITLVAMLLGVVLAGLFCDALATDIHLMSTSDRVAHVIAFGAIFFAVYGAGQIAVVLLKEPLAALALPLEHAGGLLLGLAKGIVLLEAGLFLFARYQFEPIVIAMDGSLLTPFFLRGIPFLLPLLPSGFGQAVHAFPGTPAQ
jgi:membrane protein required for colicin V production